MENKIMSPTSQISLLFCPILLFLDIFLALRYADISVSVPDVIFVGILHLVFLILVVYSLRTRFSNPSIKRPTRKQIINALPIILVASAFLTVSLLQITRLPYGDGNGYYHWLSESMSKLSLSPSSFLLDLRLYSHASQGIILFQGPAHLIAGWRGVYVMQTLLTTSSLFLLYGILRRLCKNASSILLALGTALFAFNPYILGLTSEFTPDLYNTLFIIGAVYFFLREWDYLFAFSLVLIYLSKESGILIIGVFTIVAILFRITTMGEGSFLTRARKYLWPRRLILYALPELMLLIPGLWYYPGYSISTGSSSVNVPGFSFDNFVTHLRQSVIFNFFWIGLLLVLVAFSLGIYRKIRGRNSDIIADRGAFFGLIAGFSVLLFFLSVAFISTPCPRYAQPFAFFWSVMITASALYILRNRRVQIAILLLITTVFTMQTYLTIDPSMMTNTSISLGYRSVYAPCSGPAAADCSLILLNEMYSYNRQGTYADELMNEALVYISPNRDTLFVGSWIDYNENYHAGNLTWDPAKQVISPDVRDGSFPLNFKELSIDLIENDASPDLDQDFYMILPARETGDLPSDFLYFGLEQEEMWPAFLIRKGFISDDVRVFSNQDGYLTVYHFLPPEKV